MISREEYMFALNFIQAVSSYFVDRLSSFMLSEYQLNIYYFSTFHQ